MPFSVLPQERTFFFLLLHYYPLTQSSVFFLPAELEVTGGHQCLRGFSVTSSRNHQHPIFLLIQRFSFGS